MQPKRLIIIVLVFICLTHLLYMINNAVMFRQEYESQSQAQMVELGEVVKNEIEYAMDFGIPVNSLGGMDTFLKGILNNTPELAFIQVESKGEVLFSAKRTASSTRDILVPIHGEGRQAAMIRIGIGDELTRQIFSMLFDLITIVFAGLIITFEVIRFFAAKLITTPYEQSIQTLNSTIREMDSHRSITIPPEFQGFINEIFKQVSQRSRQIHQMLSNLAYAALYCQLSVGDGCNRLVTSIQDKQTALKKFICPATKARRIVEPSQIRPVVFLFFLGANIQSSFLPIFARELLEKKTVLSNLFSQEILMGLPITCHMVMVFIVMLFMGSRQFKRRVPGNYMISIGAFCTCSGLIICGFSENIIELVAGRMLCAVGFSFIVIYSKQFIVQHSTAENRSFHLAGFTAAFSGGLFCSIIIGSILADYFSYRFVFFSGAAIVLMIYVFDYMIMADKSVADPSGDAQELSGLGAFFSSGLTDMNLICVFIHGIVTRITFIGFFYFSLPILLKADFTYADIGRMMMFYSIPSVLFGSALNKRIKKIGQSKMSVIGSNILVGIFLIFFFIPMQESLWAKTVFIPFFLLVLGASNSVTFPAQSALLLNTRTARRLGSRTALSVYNSFERIGSALGPVFYGFFISHFGMLPAVAIGGVLCILGNLIFFLFFNTDKTLGETTP